MTRDDFLSPTPQRDPSPTNAGSLTRRNILAALTGLGLGSAAFQRALAWQAEQAGKITPELIQQAEWIAGIALSDDDRKAIAGTVERFSAPDDGLSFSFLEDSAVRVGVVGRFVGGRYLQDNRELFGLEKINWAVEPGVFVEYWPLEFLRARAEIRRGFNGHEGFVADFGLDAVQRFGAFTVSIGPRLALGDSEFTRTYFGVTPAEVVAMPFVAQRYYRKPKA